MRMRGLGVYVGFAGRKLGQQSGPGQSHQREPLPTEHAASTKSTSTPRKKGWRANMSAEDYARPTLPVTQSTGVVPITISTPRVAPEPGLIPYVAKPVMPVVQVSQPTPIAVPTPTPVTPAPVVVVAPAAPPTQTIVAAPPVFTSSGGSGGGGGVSSAIFETAASPETVTVEPIAPSELAAPKGGLALAVGGAAAGFFAAGPVGGVVGGVVGYILGR